MAVDYGALRTKAYGQIKKFGARVTFSGTTTTVDHTTGGSTVTTSSVPAYALNTAPRVGLSQRVYEELGLVVSACRTLLVAPDAGYSLPTLGMRVTWADGITYTVKYVQSLEPGGTVILGTLIVSV